MSGVTGEGDKAAQAKQNVMLLQEGGNRFRAFVAWVLNLHFPTSIFVEQLQKGNLDDDYLRILLIKYFLQSIESSLV